MSFKPFTMTIRIITVILMFLFGKAGEMFILVDNVVDHQLFFNLKKFSRHIFNSNTTVA
jgi:hypothetical protein